MKAFLIGVVFLIIVSAGAFVYLKYFMFLLPRRVRKFILLQAVTKTGVLQKTNVAGSDFTHVLSFHRIPTQKSIGVASYTLSLDSYIGNRFPLPANTPETPSMQTR